MRRLSEKRGAVSILTAGALTALLGVTALAVDVGASFLRSRQLQGAADLAAIAAAGDLGNAQIVAEKSVRSNLGESRPFTVQVERGVYTPDRTQAPSVRFQSNGASPNAVRVTLHGEAPLFFSRIFTQSGSMIISRKATAAKAQLASFQIGSRLAALQGGIANSLLSGLTGSQVSLSVMDYNALVDANVDLLDYVSALRTRAHLQALTFDEIANSDIQTSDALRAIADVVNGPEAQRAGDAIVDLADASNHAPVSRLKRLVDFGPYGAQDLVSTGGRRKITVNALDLATAILEFASHDRQVQLTLDTGIPGVASVNAWLAIGEPPNHAPWLAIAADDQPIIRTAQMRLYIVANAGVAGLSGVASARLPVLVELASAQARLDSIQCAANDNNSVTLKVAPSVGSLTIGDVQTNALSNFTTTLTPGPAAVVKTLFVNVTASAHADIGGQTWQTVSFTSEDIRAGAVKTVSTNDIAQASVATLLGDTTLNVGVLGFGLNIAAVTQAVRPPLVAVAPALDTLINALIDLLGVHVGQADVRVDGVRCGDAALVQ
jgi:uncharacterized membrane protein